MMRPDERSDERLQSPAAPVDVYWCSPSSHPEFPLRHNELMTCSYRTTMLEEVLLSFFYYYMSRYLSIRVAVYVDIISLFKINPKWWSNK